MVPNKTAIITTPVLKYSPKNDLNMMAVIMQKAGINCVKYLKAGPGLAIDNAVIVNKINRIRSKRSLQKRKACDKPTFMLLFLIQRTNPLQRGSTNRKTGKI